MHHHRLNLVTHFDNLSDDDDDVEAGRRGLTGLAPVRHLAGFYYKARAVTQVDETGCVSCVLAPKEPSRRVLGDDDDDPAVHCEGETYRRGCDGKKKNSGPLHPPLLYGRRESFAASHASSRDTATHHDGINPRAGQAVVGYQKDVVSYLCVKKAAQKLSRWAAVKEKKKKTLFAVVQQLICAALAA